MGRFLNMSNQVVSSMYVAAILSPSTKWEAEEQAFVKASFAKAGIEVDPAVVQRAVYSNPLKQGKKFKENPIQLILDWGYVPAYNQGGSLKFGVKVNIGFFNFYLIPEHNPAGEYQAKWAYPSKLLVVPHKYLKDAKASIEVLTAKTGPQGYWTKTAAGLKADPGYKYAPQGIDFDQPGSLLSFSYYIVQQEDGRRHLQLGDIFGIFPRIHGGMTGSAPAEAEGDALLAKYSK